MRRIGNWILALTIIASSVIVVVPFAPPQAVMAMSGSGTSGDPWVVMNVTDLQAIGTGSYLLSHYYELGQDIDASATVGWNGGSGFVPLGSFTGHFDGNGYTISELYMYWVSAASATLNIGLFTSLSNATVKNLRITDAYMKGQHTISGRQCLGGILAAQASGNNLLVQQVLVHGTLELTATKTSSPYLHSFGGGLIGYLYCLSPAVVERCAAFVDVSGYSPNYALYSTGGLIGHQQGSVVTRNSYARGSVFTQKSYPTATAGGLVGRTYDVTYIDDCYSTGLVTGGLSTTKGGFNGKVVGSSPVITNCFWDKEVSGQTTSSGGTGKTTAEMKTQATYTNAGWDFDTICGRSGYINNDYLYL